MSGEKDLNKLLKTLKPVHNADELVFCVVNDLHNIDLNNIILFFREEETFTIIIEKKLADDLKLTYLFIASWITLSVNSSLEAVGLTAAFSSALSAERISCNVVAAFHRDHIFVNRPILKRPWKF